jgi:hypothetical protein
MFMILGNMIYMVADLAPTVDGKMAMVLIARMVMGTGAGEKVE